jgi:predicted nucleic acid-binding protein
MTRFLDANIFIYAYYKPRKQLLQKEKQMKQQAQQIIRNVTQGKEQVATTVVHLSETANILKHAMNSEQLTRLLRALYMHDNITIYGVTRDAYLAAVELADDLKLEPNDALAIDIMKQNGVTEIYTFDQDFNNLQGITKLP